MNYAPLTIEGSMNVIADYIETAFVRFPEVQAMLRDRVEPRIAETPYSVVYEEDRVKLKHYAPAVKSKYNTPLFIVYALINRETMLDLQPDRSVIRQLMKSGIDLYVLDWGYPTRKDRFLSIDDHVNVYMDNAIDVIRERTGVDQVNLMGACMGGTFSAIYASLHPEKVKNLVLAVTPTSFKTDAGLLHTWWGHKTFDVDRFVDNHGNVPGDYLNALFLMLNPAKLIIDKYVSFYKSMHDKDAVQNFMRMEKWIFDSPDVPGETFREFIKHFYQEDRFIRNALEIGGVRVDLNRITMPVLNIYAQYDHLVPTEACTQFIHKIASTDTQDLCLKTGHIGIFVSSESQKKFAPTIIRWLGDRDGKQEGLQNRYNNRQDQVKHPHKVMVDNRRANSYRPSRL